jgi:hypothetical protein
MRQGQEVYVCVFWNVRKKAGRKDRAGGVCAAMQGDIIKKRVHC